MIIFFGKIQNDHSMNIFNIKKLSLLVFFSDENAPMDHSRHFVGNLLYVLAGALLSFDNMQKISGCGFVLN